MEFIDEDSKISIIFETSVMDFYLNYMEKYDFKVESGGILVGYLNPADRQVIITDVTTPFLKDCRCPCSFKRSEHGHQQEMDRLWEESNHTKTYLGEWHTHRQTIPIPSFIDTRDWKRISKIELNYKQPFFVIIGKEKIKAWTVSKEKVVMLKEVERIGENC